VFLLKVPESELAQFALHTCEHPSFSSCLALKLGCFASFLSTEREISVVKLISFHFFFDIEGIPASNR
jgi:hypothetical protein